MTKPKGSATFQQNDNQLLALALLTRNGGPRASERLGITDGVVAIGFDLAVSLRLVMFEAEQARANAKLIAYEVSKLFGDPEDGGNGD